MTNLLNQTAIVGIRQTEFSKNSGRSELQLALEGHGFCGRPWRRQAVASKTEEIGRRLPHGRYWPGGNPAGPIFPSAAAST
jgi:hypothetical protein